MSEVRKAIATLSALAAIGPGGLIATHELRADYRAKEAACFEQTPRTDCTENLERYAAAVSWILGASALVSLAAGGAFYAMDHGRRRDID